jgi:hypothetical protein
MEFPNLLTENFVPVIVTACVQLLANGIKYHRLLRSLLIIISLVLVTLLGASSWRSGEWSDT